MKTILILGGFGFLGSNILRFLEDAHNDYELIVFDKLSEHPGGLIFPRLKKAYAGDFSDKESLKKIFRENKIDLVIHAISSTVPANSDDMEFDIRTNLIPTINLLNILKEFNVKNIVYISSGGAIYGKQGNKHSESDEASPISSYGIVKLAIEKYLLLSARQYGLRPLILRPSNLYGLYHYSKKQGVINIAINNALSGQKLFVWGTGENKKDYIYIEDFCRILFSLIEKNIFNEVINVGSGDLLSVNKILIAIKEMIPGFEWQYQEAATFDVPEVILDTTKLMGYVGEYKFKNFVDCIHEILAWQKSQKELSKV